MTTQEKQNKPMAWGKEYKETENTLNLLKEKAESLKQNQKASLDKDFSFKVGATDFNSKMLNNPFIKKVTVDNTKDGDNVTLNVYRQTVLCFISNNYNTDLRSIQQSLVSEMGTDGVKAFNGYVNEKVKQHKPEILKSILA